jgi:hypothetical protein
LSPSGVLGKFVTEVPLNHDINVTKRMPYIMLPLISFIDPKDVIMKPTTPSQNFGLCNFPPLHSPVTGFVLAQAVMVTNVEESGPTRPTPCCTCKPTNAMKRPIPAALASRTGRGISLESFARRPIADIAKKAQPVKI